MQLPDKPSELLAVALRDLELCEQDPRYVINMDQWHLPIADGLCAVCLGGAVLAKSLGTPIHFLTDGNLHFEANKLTALDAFRFGGIHRALRRLGIQIPESVKQFAYVTEYRKEPERFKDDIRTLIDYLQTKGL
jgi:hypothetical protein